MVRTNVRTHVRTMVHVYHRGILTRLYQWYSVERKLTYPPVVFRVVSRRRCKVVQLALDSWGPIAIAGYQRVGGH